MNPIDLRFAQGLAKRDVQRKLRISAKKSKQRKKKKKKKKKKREKKRLERDYGWSN